MDKRFVVLVVEDEKNAQDRAREVLLPHAEVLIAGSMRKALGIIRERSDLTHVTLDGRVPMFEGEPLRNGDTTHFLVYEIMDVHPAAKIFAASSDKDLNTELVNMDCIHADKDTASQMVVDDIQRQKTS